MNITYLSSNLTTITYNVYFIDTTLFNDAFDLIQPNDSQIEIHLNLTLKNLNTANDTETDLKQLMKDAEINQTSNNNYKIYFVRT